MMPTYARVKVAQDKKQNLGDMGTEEFKGPNIGPKPKISLPL